MPIVQKFVEDLVGTRVERGVDPMECVAQGAAVQAGVLAGEVKDILLLDVTPLSLGIETLGGVCTKLIDRNTTIPVQKSQVFSTAADFQTAVDIHVLQGERPMARDNVELGKFQLLGIPPSPRGVPQVEVSFDIDANGILHVTAKDLGTNKEQKMKIIAPLKMRDDEIKTKMKEADEYSEADKKALELATTKNEAESLVYVAEKEVKELKDKLSADIQERITKAASKLKETMKSDDVGKIRTDIEALKAVLQEAGSAIYQQTGGAGAGSAGPNTGGGSGAQGGSEAGWGPEPGGNQAGSSGSGRKKKKGPNGEDIVEGEYEKMDDDKK